MILRNINLPPMVVPLLMDKKIIKQAIELPKVAPINAMEIKDNA